MKKLLGMLVCLMVCHMMTAAPVDKATALQSATSFMQQKGWNVSKQPRLAPVRLRRRQQRKTMSICLIPTTVLSLSLATTRQSLSLDMSRAHSSTRTRCPRI